jgi:hypothetical protein
MLGIAAFTMVASLAVLAPVGADAADGEEAKTAESLKKVNAVISMPKLEEDNCVVTLKADKESYAAGEKPVLTVEVKNDGKEAIEKSITVSMSTRDLESRGRMPAMTVVVWSKTTTVKVAAGETASVKLETETEVDASKANSFSMSGDKEEVVKEARLRRAVEGAVRRNAN